jgi:Ca2+-transporting ATPase
LPRPPRSPRGAPFCASTRIWCRSCLFGIIVSLLGASILNIANGVPFLGLTTFLVAVVLLSFESRDQRRSVFNLEVLDDRTFLIATGISAAVIYLGTSFSGFQRILDTTALSLNQWILCILAGAGVVLASEIRKVILPRRLPDPDQAVA